MVITYIFSVLIKIGWFLMHCLVVVLMLGVVTLNLTGLSFEVAAAILWVGLWAWKSTVVLFHWVCGEWREVKGAGDNND